MANHIIEFEFTVRRSGAFLSSTRVQTVAFLFSTRVQTVERRDAVLSVFKQAFPAAEGFSVTLDQLAPELHRHNLGGW